MDPAPQGAFDIHPTVLRLRDDVGKLTSPRTAQHFEEALCDLAMLPPWDQAEPGALAQDFLATVDRLDPKTRKVLRLTLGLDEASETLTARRALLRADSTGGSGHIVHENYELAKALAALLAWRGGPREGSLPGFVIRDVAVAASVVKSGMHLSVKVVAECQRDGARSLVVPAPRTLFRLKTYTAKVLGDGSQAVRTGRTTARPFSNYNDEYAPRYYEVKPPRCIAGTRVEVALASPRRRIAEKLGLTSGNSLSWQCDGNEERVRLEVVGPSQHVLPVEGLEGDAHTKTDYAPGDGDTGTWSLTREAPSAERLVLKWGNRA